jgi:hypothetical protein
MKALTLFSTLLFLLSPLVVAWNNSYSPPPPSTLQSQLPHLNTCSQDVTFTLSNIIYFDYLIYSTPAHLAVSIGTINFTMTNSATLSNVLCQGQATTPFVFFPGWQSFNCSTEAISPIFTYGQPNFFQVNDTWSCTDYSGKRLV